MGIIKKVSLKLLKTLLWLLPFVLLLFITYNFFNGFLLKVLTEEESIKQALALVTFIGGLLGAVLLETLKKIWWRPSITITSWLKNKSNSLMRKIEGGNIDFIIRVKNTSSIMAENCEIKLTIKYDRDDIEACSLSEVDCNTYLKINQPFIKNRDEFAEIIDENVLWDLQYKGEHPLKINIQPQISYLSTIARYKAAGMYLEIPSENYMKPRVLLKPFNEDNGEDVKPKRYTMRITLCGDNFSPVIKEESIQVDDYDPVHHLNLHQLQLQIEITKAAFGGG